MKFNPGIDQLLSLKGKRALITGAGSGIGKSIARRFAEAGAALILVDINRNCLATLKEELSSPEVEVNCWHADLSSKKEIDHLWERLRNNSPAILVNNAGIYPFKHFLDVDESLYRLVMETNLDAVYWMRQHMIARRHNRQGTRGGAMTFTSLGSRSRKDMCCSASPSKTIPIVLSMPLICRR